MYKKLTLCLVALLCLAGMVCSAQSIDSGSVAGAANGANKVLSFPSRVFEHVQQRTARLDAQLTRQTEKYLERMAKREARLKARLSKVDSAGAQRLFAGSEERCAALLQKIKTDTGNVRLRVSGPYQAYVDSVQGMLAFLKKDGRAMQQLQGKMADAGEVKNYIQERRQQVGQYIAQHANAEAILGKAYTGMKQDAYYYSQQLQEYKNLFNDPDKLERKALAQLNQLPAFQAFMKSHSQLAGLFGVPGGGGAARALAGLQTRDQISQQVQQQVTSAGSGGMESLQSQLGEGKAQLDSYKGKLEQLGGGNGDADIPSFRPNEQKTKTFFRRLEYGANFQTTRGSYYFPVTTDLGLSLGYKLGRGNVIGVGASYKVGWGSGFNHIAFSSQGVGLRSFLEVKLKGSFSATGGFEYNYATPFSSFQQLQQLERWTKSGLIGVSKTVSMRGRVLKKTKMQLLWDFFSYSQAPRTQALVFRIGYNF
ncbi:MAG: hypothetical protein JST68_29400 [Bacteroidetes bacterium]|nr:hypothetical protein [Bacteroidota bacterium]